MKDNEVCVFVYGSLMKGFGLSRYLNDSTFLGTTTTTAKYTLIDLGFYPGLLNVGHTQVAGEAYQIDQATLSTLDYIELSSGYRRDKIELIDNFNNTVYAYLYNYGHDGNVVVSGDWRKKS